MSYAVLIRKKEGGRANTTTWTLETYSPENGVSSDNLDQTDQPLIVVLAHLEMSKRLRMVGQDGPDTFILHAVDPPRVSLRNC